MSLTRNAGAHFVNARDSVLAVSTFGATSISLLMFGCRIWTTATTIRLPLRSMRGLREINNERRRELSVGRPRYGYPPRPDKEPPFPTEPPLEQTLASLTPWWIRARCSCGTTSDLPCRWLAAHQGWRVTLGQVLPRLKCSRCGERPHSLSLTDTRGAPGSNTVGRHLELPIDR